MPTNAASWGKVHSLLWRLHRLKVFDRTAGGAGPLKYRDMLRPGRVSVIDLSDAGMSELSNIAVADVLRGVQEEQDGAYRAFEARQGGRAATCLVGGRGGARVLRRPSVWRRRRTCTSRWRDWRSAAANAG